MKIYYKKGLLSYLGWIFIGMYIIRITFGNLPSGFSLNPSGLTDLLAEFTLPLIGIGLLYLDKRLSRNQAKKE